MRLASVALAVAVIASCGTPSASPPTPSPITSVRASASAAPSTSPSVVPGSSVRLVVDGIAVQPGVQVTLSGGPATVVIVFPFDVDRASVQPFLPSSANPMWQDDHTVRLVIPASAIDPAFKVPRTVSKDGRQVLDLFVVNLTNPPSMALSTYTVAELLARPTPPKADAVHAPSTHRAVFIPSPDSKRVLSWADTTAEPIVRAIDIGTGSAQLLTLPSGRSLLAGWAGNDAIIVVGEGAWSVPVNGGAPRALVDLKSSGIPLVAVASPKGTFVAVATKDRLAVFTVATGALRPVASVAITCAAPQTVTPWLAWSSDEQRLALSDCASATSGPIRTRILEPASGATVAIIDGGEFGIRSLLTGDLMVTRLSGQTGEGAHQLFIVYSFSGVEKTRILGNAPTLSPDGRYVLDYTCCAGEGFTLAPIGTDPDRGAQGPAVWLPDGRVLVVTR